MPRRRSTQAAERNVRIDQAIEALKNREFKSPYAAAIHFRVSRNTLTRRLDGRQTQAQANEATQLLSKAEEDALFLWCRRLTAGGCPASHRVMREMAIEILLQRVATVNTEDMQLVNTLSIGKEWIKRFIKRHPTLSTTRSRSIDLSRWKDTTLESINEWFDVFEDMSRINHFDIHNIYNIDETGFAIESSQSNRVIIDTDLRTRYKVQPGRQEWVSIVECICADKTVLPPLVIFKVKTISNNWISESTPHDWIFSCSSKGWTSNQHGIE